MSGWSGQSEFDKGEWGAGAGASAWHWYLLGHVMRCSVGLELAVVISVSGVEGCEELHLAWEFGLGGNRWHEIRVA
jgi:hypothetical protein